MAKCLRWSRYRVVGAAAALDPVWSRLSPHLGCVRSDRPQRNRHKRRARSPATVSDRTRLLDLHREAVSLLNQAARADAAGDAVRRAALEAGHRFEALGAEPDPDSNPNTQRPAASGATALIAPALRADLRRAAAELAAFAATPTDVTSQRLDAAPFLGLLENVRNQLEGEVALGLSFKGSYSQTRPTEPVLRRACVRHGPSARSGYPRQTMPHLRR